MHTSGPNQSTARDLRAALRLVGMALALASLGTGSDFRSSPLAIKRALDAPPCPDIVLDPTLSRVALIYRERYPFLRDLASDPAGQFWRLADFAANGSITGERFSRLEIVQLASGTRVEFPLKAGALYSRPVWSPDGRSFALTMQAGGTARLLVAKPTIPETKRLRHAFVQPGFGDWFYWMPDSRMLVARLAPPTKEPVQPPNEKIEPTILSTGHPEDRSWNAAGAALRLGKNQEEQSQLALVDTVSGATKRFGTIGKFAHFQPSPDGRFLLVAISRGTESLLYELWPVSITRRNIGQGVPVSLNRLGVLQLPQWHPSEPATLVWVQPITRSGQHCATCERSRLMRWNLAAGGQPTLAVSTPHHIARYWLGPSCVIIQERVPGSAAVLMSVARAAAHPTRPRALDPDLYRGSAGSSAEPVTTPVGTGHKLVIEDGASFFLYGVGTSPEGDRPFVRRVHLDSLRSEPVFMSESGKYESVVNFLARDGTVLLTRRESPHDARNYFIRRLNTSACLTPITDLRPPIPELQFVRRVILRYVRKDGVRLAAMLYAPPNKGLKALPALFWAYPREFSESELASQFAGSANRHPILAGFSPLFAVLAGYAVLDSVSMPVIGPPATVNDSYIEQISANAEAAIDAAAATGVIDRTRVAVGGHSYGAAMAVHLLARTSLFQAGVACSGSYNRTLTPFGFQNEQRTLWQAPQLYLRMSPVMIADKITRPLLILHGAADSNPATPPEQATLLFSSIAGNGGTARLVLLPSESHIFRARESIEHALAEMIEWLDNYVKGP